jgi:outer membrane lipoprotein-sorting protein
MVLLLWATAADSRAQDGNALMHKMLDAYLRLNTYEVHSNVDLTAIANGRPIQSKSSSNDMLLKRPNKIFLTIFNAGPTGTRQICSDGTTLTVYDALPNRYTTGPAAPNMEVLMHLLAQRAMVTAELDPLYFFCTNKLPKTLSDLKAGGSTTVNGHLSLILTGIVRSGSASPGKGRTVTSNVSHVTWYIDQQTYLLNKLEAHSDPVAQKVMTRVKGKLVPTTLNIVITIHHSVGSYKANPPIEDNAFVFKAPPGATLQK